MKTIRIALAQINTTVGALEKNGDKIITACQEAHKAGAQVVLFPELAISGYPLEDLLLKDHFVEDAHAAVLNLAAHIPDNLVAVIGCPNLGTTKASNAAIVLERNNTIATYHKMLLPNYGVFDEQRVFEPGQWGMELIVNGCRLGIHICEDSWYTDQAPCALFENHGLHGLLNLSSSPYHHNKDNMRDVIIGKISKKLNTHVFYCNLVGGQDELVFDGGSIVLDPSGQIVHRAPQFVETMLLYDLPYTPHPPAAVSNEHIKTVHVEVSTPPSSDLNQQPAEQLDDLEEIYRALQLGLKDYVHKNGFKEVLVAISGGIDSALVAALAVDALGKDRVTGITMPSQYSSDETLSDAELLGQNLGIQFRTVPIKNLFDQFRLELAPHWEGKPEDVTEENLQARIRGNIVMAFSNKFGALVLTTGNKSELATGYCTLYGDMVGGFAVIKDVPKTMVFDLCRWRNTLGDKPVIPPSTIDRPPSAELRPDQKDTDSLPPYEVLDDILARYVEQDEGLESIIAAGFEEALVRRIIRLVDINEYKRRQGAPGVKITPKAFGKDRRLPITNQYRE